MWRTVLGLSLLALGTAQGAGEWAKVKALYRRTSGRKE